MQGVLVSISPCELAVFCFEMGKRKSGEGLGPDSGKKSKPKALGDGPGTTMTFGGSMHSRAFDPAVQQCLKLFEGWLYPD